MLLVLLPQRQLQCTTWLLLLQAAWMLQLCRQASERAERTNTCAREDQCSRVASCAACPEKAAARSGISQRARSLTSNDWQLLKCIADAYASSRPGTKRS
jgi:hypothetical protein